MIDLPPLLKISGKNSDMYFPSNTHSMEGSVAKLHEIVELKKKYKVSIHVLVCMRAVVLASARISYIFVCFAI